MSTTVRGSTLLDAATLGTAAARLEREINAPLQSNGSAEQNFFVGWLDENRTDLDSLDHMSVKASNDHTVLNKFLVAAGYPELFEPFPPNCHGVAAILDMIVKWQEDAERTTVDSMTGAGERTFDAFSIPVSGAYIYRVEGRSELLVQLLTKDGSSLWITEMAQPQSGLELLDFATKTMNTRHTPYLNRYTDVVVPSVSVKRDVSLQWLIGASCGPQSIGQAFQMVSVDIDETGGHVKTMTGIATRECVSVSEPLVFDKPFALWFTQGHNRLPIATIYAHHDTWRPVS